MASSHTLPLSSSASQRDADVHQHMQCVSQQQSYADQQQHAEHERYGDGLWQWHSDGFCIAITQWYGLAFQQCQVRGIVFFSFVFMGNAWNE